LLSLALYGWKRRWRWSVVKAIGVVAIIAAYPLVDMRFPIQTPTQVVYRFDDHRYLELIGFGCEGALYYVDPKQQIRTEVASQFYRLFLKPYIHPSTHYIAIPLVDGSSFIVSNDGGRTFRGARYGTIYKEGKDVFPYDGGQDRPRYDVMERFVVVNDQGFLELNDGRIYMSSRPSKETKWGATYVDAIGLKHSVLADYPEFQNLPTKVPEVKNYTGWTRMQCDPDLRMAPPPNPFVRAQEIMFDIEAATIGAPVYFGLMALGRN
jgi:hypothetical protein